MTRSRSLLAVLSVALVVAVSGCGGSGSKSATGSDPSGTATTGSATQGATKGPDGKVTGAASAPAAKPRTVSAKNGPAAKRWLADNYPDATWVKDVKDVNVSDNTLVASTKLTAKASGAVSELCQALTMYAVLEVEGGFTAVSVKGSNGKTIVTRKNLSKPC